MTGAETFDVLDLGGEPSPGMPAHVRIHAPQREPIDIAVRVRLDTRNEVLSFLAGGLLPRIYRAL